MAYNTTFTRFKSTDLAGLDCGSALRIPRRDRKITQTSLYTGDLEIGQCVAMIRVPAGARIVGGLFAWDGPATAPTAILAVGDPYACGRLFGPIATRYRASSGLGGSAIDCCYLTKIGRNGDGCGLFYQYTCETDIVITNLYKTSNAAEGGFLSGSEGQAGAGIAAAKWSGGSLTLTIEYLQQS